LARRWRYPARTFPISDNKWRLQKFGAIAWDATSWLTFSPSFEHNHSVAEQRGAAPQHFLDSSSRPAQSRRAEYASAKRIDGVKTGGGYMRNFLSVNLLMQVGLVGFTAIGFLLTSLKWPEYGVIVNFISQFFWLYSGYIAWREANHIGVFIVSIILTVVLMVGVINYWVL
jgi:hypothetical protein